MSPKKGHHYVMSPRRNDSPCSQILDHPYILLIIGGSGSGKTNAWLDLISYQSEIDKI